METKKYTNHFYFWMHIATFIVFMLTLILDIINIRKRPNTLLIVLMVLLSISLVVYLVLTIKEGLAWQSYLEISEEGVKMKGCAKRISDKKKETIDDIFISWGDIEEIKGGIGGPVLVLKTGEKIRLTQQMDVDCSTFMSAFDRYKFKQQQQKEPVQSPDEIISVISVIDDNDKPMI